MNNIKNVFYFFCAVVLLNACGDTFSTVVEIDPPEFESKLTFTTFITAGDTVVEMFVGRNRGILEEAESVDYNLDNAKVTITRVSDGSSVDTDTNGIDVNDPFNLYGNINYAMLIPDSAFFSPGDSYVFIVEHPDFITSETELLFPDESGVLENLVYKREDGLDEEFDESSSITFDILETAGKEEFFELAATVVDGFLGQSTFWISTLDPIGTKGSPNDNLFISDETFDGERKNIKIKFDRFLYDPDLHGYVELTWSNVNEGHYNYSRTISRYRDADGVPFLSPVRVSSNVNNALGNISLKTEIKYEVR